MPDRQGFDSLTLVQVMQRLKVPGVSIAVVKDFQVHWAKAYGTADVATGRPVETATRFQAASISKPVTAMAAMRLAQEHRLDLDADVNTMLSVVEGAGIGAHARAARHAALALQPHVRAPTTASGSRATIPPRRVPPWCRC